jgi:uncharacterized protein
MWNRERRSHTNGNMEHGGRGRAEGCRRRRLPLAVVLVLAAALAAAPAAWAVDAFRIGTGGSTGVYYPIGKAIAAGLDRGRRFFRLPTPWQNCHCPELCRFHRERAWILIGDLEAGLVQADIAALAEQRQGAFSQLPREGALRALAALYPEKLQVVVRRDAGVTKFVDLRGKRFSVDEEGSGTRAIMSIALAAHGLSESDLQPLYLKPAFTEDKMRNGQLQGFAIMAGTPNVAVSKLAEVGVTLVPVMPEVAARIHQRHPFLTPGMVGGDIYPGVAETPTLEVHALLVVSAAMPEDLAHSVTEALFAEHTGALLRQGHPLGKAIGLDSALRGLSIPLHQGAERFYRQRRMVP